MNKELFELKKRVISAISDKTYYGLINFAEKIYNADHDVVILMARKASNLYQALLPLLREEYLGSIEEEHKSRGNHTAEVISDRAIERVLSDIKENGKKTKYKRILVADDIIIHGTTIARIREKLQKAYAEAGIPEDEYQIDIMAYAENIDGIALSAKDICNANTIVKCSRSSWKKISNRIINILHIMGRTYTSYVPNAEIRMDSLQGKSIASYIREGKVKEIRDLNMQRRNVRVYVGIQESEDEYAICETYRIFEYKHLNKYVFVPMVIINPINEEMLKRYIEILSEYVTEESRPGIEKMAWDFETEYPYRLAIYILSSLAGWKFFEAAFGQKADDCNYEVREEIMNFSCPFLCKFSGAGDAAKISETFREINIAYNRLKAEMVYLEDQAMGEDVQQLKSEVDEIVKYVQREGKEKESEFSDDIIAKIMETNSRLDEEKFGVWKGEKRKEIRKRMKGISVANMYGQLKWRSDSVERNSKALIHAIDTGKGSIVPFIVKCSNQKIFISMLRSGEQNYRYYVDNYLPIMYGFYLLETMDLDQKRQREQKEYLWSQYYGGNKMPLFGEMDKEYLMNNISMNGEFEDVILDEVLCEKNEKILEIDKIINSQMAG